MFDKIKLPYETNALEPYIDEETVKIHYEKHLQKYLDNLNNIVKDYEEFFKGKTLGEVLSNLDKIPKSIKQDVVNNGGGVYNHNLYFSMFSAEHKKEPGNGKLLKAINRDFGSFHNMKEEMIKTAINQFGSGYTFIVKSKDGKLSIRKTSNQNTPICKEHMPILALDVWEHAYYLKYRNLRSDYVGNYFNLVDWDKVEKLYIEGKANF